MDEKIEKWLDEHDGEDLCKYCFANRGCAHGVACYGGEPVFPKCADSDVEDYLDLERLEQDIEEGKA